MQNISQDGFVLALVFSVPIKNIVEAFSLIHSYRFGVIGTINLKFFLQVKRVFPKKLWYRDFWKSRHLCLEIFFLGILVIEIFFFVFWVFCDVL